MKNKFRIIRFFLVFAMPLLFFQNCSNDNIQEVEDVNISESQNTKLLEALKELGFSVDKIEDKGGYYVVEDDMVFDKNKKYLFLDDINTSKETRPKTSKTKQRKTPFPVTVKDINVFLNPGMNTNWINASRSAIARWNAVYSGLHLTEVFSAASAHIQIMYDIHDPSLTLGNSVFGRGLFPTGNGLPGTRTWINHDINFQLGCGIALTQNARIANVQHELGHNLGIAHTNENNWVKIPGTPATDSGSLMNGDSACTIANFSSFDETAIEYLFPVPTISGSPLICNTETKTYTLVGASSATWQLSSNLQPISSTSTSITVKPINSTVRGSAYVKATTIAIAIQKDFYVGKPSLVQLTTNSGVPYDVYNLPAGCEDGNTYWEFKSSNVLDQASEFQFSISGGTPIVKTVINGSVKLTALELGILEGQTLTVNVRPVNSCGSDFLVPAFTLYRPTSCECGIGPGCALP